MSDPLSDLPRYPEASTDEERQQLRGGPPDSFRVWLRYSWIKLTIVGVVAAVWLLGLIGFILAAPDPWAALGVHLLLTLAPVGMGLRGAAFGSSWWKSGSGD